MKNGHTLHPNAAFWLHSLLVCCFGVSLLACKHQNSAAQQVAVPQDADAIVRRLDSLEREIFPNGITQTVDTALAHPYVRAVERFANDHRDHPRTPQLLMQAAGLANGSSWSNKSIQLWGYVWRRYPEHEKAPEALFYQGFVMDTRYEDYPLAIEYYDRFLKYFPEHDFVDQVRQLREVALKGGSIPDVPPAPGN